MNEWALKLWLNHASLTCQIGQVLQAENENATAWEKIKHYSNFLSLFTKHEHKLPLILKFTLKTVRFATPKDTQKSLPTPNSSSKQVHKSSGLSLLFFNQPSCFAVTCHIFYICILTQKHKRKPSRFETHQKGKHNLICGF